MELLCWSTLVAEPLSALETFASRRQSDNTESLVDQVRAQVQQQQHNWTQVPLFNFEQPIAPGNRRLVRLRGMVQDMHEPELVFCATGQPGCALGAMFREAWDCDETDEQYEADIEQQLERYETRLPVIVVPIPGETRWSKETTFVGQEDIVESSEISKKPKLNADKLLSVVAKVYGEAMEIRLNEVYEFIGVYYERTTGQSQPNDGPDATVPCIHVIGCQKSTTLHPKYFTVDSVTNDFLHRTVDVATARQQLLSVLTMLLRGDTLAAEYLLCNLLSSVRSRVGTMAIGNLPLNLFNIDDKLVMSLVDTLQHLLPTVLRLSLTLDTLNAEKLMPSKDYDKNQLISNKLQLPAGSQLIIDETCMQVGQLNQLGIQNLASLKSIMDFQVLNYDFVFQNYSYDTNIQMLILSQGISMFKVNWPLPVEQKENVHQPAENGELFGTFRDYLALSKHVQFSGATESTQNTIVTDFVAARRTDNGVTEMVLHQWIAIANLLAISYGRSELDEECWRKAMSMEEERRRRLAPYERRS